MTTPRYLLDKIARHGPAAERLRMELRATKLDDNGIRHAVAFDAANFIWAFLALCEAEDVQDSRHLRNRIAEAIFAALEGLDEKQLQLDAGDL